MKTKLIALTALLLTLTSIHARAPHERSSFEQMFDQNQHGKIAATMINNIDSQVEDLVKNYELELAKTPNNPSHTEGAIIAGLQNIIEKEIRELEHMQDELRGYSYISNADLDALSAKVKGIQQYINEINP